MTFMPVVERELRVASRSKATYRLRFFALGVALLFCSILYWVFRDSSRNLGLVWFTGVGLTQLLMCLYSISLVSDAIAGEKRDGTIGLLMITKLTPLDVVIGKVARAAAVETHALLGLIPLAGIAIVLGGVTGWDLVRVAITSVNTIFLTLGIGIFFSALDCKRLRATALAALVVYLLMFLVPMIGLLRGRFGSEFLLWISPSYTMVMAFDAIKVRVGYFDRFWISLLIQHSLAWVCLFASAMALRQTWRNVPSTRSPSFRSWFRGKPSNAEAGFSSRRADLDNNPFLWKGKRGHNQYWVAWLILVVSVGFAVVLTWGASQPRLLAGLHVLVWFVAVLAGSWMSMAAASEMFQEKLAGTIDLLITTRCTIDEMMSGYASAWRQVFRVPTALVVALLLMLSGLGIYNSPMESKWLWVINGAAAIVLVYVAQTNGVYSGFRWGLTNYTTAAKKLQLWIGLVIFYGQAILFLMVFIFENVRGVRTFGFPLVLAFNLSLMICLNLRERKRSRRELIEKFREYALLPISPEFRSKYEAMTGTSSAVTQQNAGR